MWGEHWGEHIHGPECFSLEGGDGGQTLQIEQAMAEAFARFFRTLRRAALESDTIDVDALPWGEAEKQLFEDWDDIARASAGSTAAAEMAKLGGEGIIVDNPWVERWLVGHGAEMVTEVSSATQAGIRAAIRDGMLEHKTVAETARALRGMVGLREDQLRAVDRAAQVLIADGVEGEALERRLAALARRKVAERALLIGRTETMSALNEGKLSGWQHARDNGLLLPQAQRVWIGNAYAMRGGKQRTCDRCSSFIGTTAPLDGNFTSRSGEIARGPPIHPNDRCGQGLKTVMKSVQRFFGRWWSPSRLR